MKNYLKALGIFALIFSLSLFVFGSSELEKVSQESFFSEAESTPQESLSYAHEIKFQDGILQHKTEISEMHHVVRKFPAALGLLFLLLKQDISESQEQLFAADLSSLPSKDLPVSYHNLRI